MRRVCNLFLGFSLLVISDMALASAGVAFLSVGAILMGLLVVSLCSGAWGVVNRSSKREKTAGSERGNAIASHDEENKNVHTKPSIEVEQSKVACGFEAEEADDSKEEDLSLLNSDEIIDSLYKLSAIDSEKTISLEVAVPYNNKLSPIENNFGGRFDLSDDEAVRANELINALIKIKPNLVVIPFRIK